MLHEGTAGTIGITLGLDAEMLELRTEVTVLQLDASRRSVELAMFPEVARVPLHNLAASGADLLRADGTSSAAEVASAQAPWGPVHSVSVGIGETLRYTVPIVNASAPRPRGPSYDLRGTENGVAGALLGAVALPLLSDELWQFELTFDTPDSLSLLSSQGGSGASWRGSGFEAGVTFLIGGRVRSFVSSEQNGFSAHWFSGLQFDGLAGFEFAHAALLELRRRLEVGESRPYRLFVRPGVNFRDGGAATRNGFMLELGNLPHTLAGREFMFTHEIAHHFAWGLSGDLSTIAWYAEGLAEFYKIDIVRGLGLASPEDVATEINTMCRAYYTNTARLLPVSEVAGQHWNNADVQGLPYNRGFMYFVRLSHSLQAQGLSLDELVRTVTRRRLAGEHVGNDDWREILGSLGTPGAPALVEDFDAMLAGELIQLPDDAFGTEFSQSCTVLQRRALGFDEMSLTPLPGAVRGVVAGSPAEKAGLRDGDTIVGFDGVQFSSLHSSPGAIASEQMSLRIERESQQIEIEFSPEAAECVAWLWKPTASPDERSNA